MRHKLSASSVAAVVAAVASVATVATVATVSTVDWLTSVDNAGSTSAADDSGAGSLLADDDDLRSSCRSSASAGGGGVDGGLKLEVVLDVDVGCLDSSGDEASEKSGLEHLFFIIAATKIWPVYKALN